MRTMTKRKKESQTKRDSGRHCELLRYVTQENNLSVVCLYESIVKRANYTMGDDICTTSYELYI